MDPIKLFNSVLRSLEFRGKLLGNAARDPVLDPKRTAAKDALFGLAGKSF